MVAAGRERKVAATPLHWRRLPLLALGMAALLAALAGGLARLHWRVPGVTGSWITYHGALMVGGFLGTVIGLERAVAVGRRPAYLVPALAAAGGLSLLAGFPRLPGAALLALAAAGLVILYATLLARQWTPHTATMALGAACWLVGNLLWLVGWEVPEVVPWWLAFLILTIAGERLELSRFRPPGRLGERLFVAATTLFLAGVALTAVRPDGGWRLLGVGEVALAAWLGRYDIARHTVRRPGLPRFVAICLLSGYVWLALGGGFAVAVGGPPGGDLPYDLLLHPVFLGFVMSMIFGHAPIIFPAILGRPLPFHRRFYLHLALLHASLVARIVGDLTGVVPLRGWGGLLNVVAILLFLLSTASAVVAGEGPRR